MIIKNKIAICFLFLFLINFISASDLGIGKQNEDFTFYQMCSNCSYVNLTSITFPNKSVQSFGVLMDKQGPDYFYTFNDTSQIGKYSFNVCGDKDGSFKCEVIKLEITLNGKPQADGILIVVYTLMFILFIGFGITYFIISLGHVIQLDMDLIDATVMISAYLGMWVFYYVSFEYLGNAIVNEILEIAISVGSVTHVFLPIVGFLVSFIMTNLKFKKKARITY